MATHELKTDPDVFDAVASGMKNFEIRFNDRGYQPGDWLRLLKTRYTREQMNAGQPLEYTGDVCIRVVAYVLEGRRYGLKGGFVGLSLQCPVPEAAGPLDQMGSSPASKAARAHFWAQAVKPKQGGHLQKIGGLPIYIWYQQQPDGYWVPVSRPIYIPDSELAQEKRNA